MTIIKNIYNFFSFNLENWHKVKKSKINKQKSKDEKKSKIAKVKLKEEANFSLLQTFENP